MAERYDPGEGREWRGTALKERRRAAGLSIDEMLSVLRARGHGVAKGSYYRWESSDRTPLDGTCRVLGEILGCSPEEFFGEVE